MAYELPKLPYGYNSLEPHIDARTMEIHHTKHHQAYIDKLNAALEEHGDLSALSLEALLGSLDRVPDDIRTVVRNNGGGHANHSLFWESMSPNGGGEPSGDLATALSDTFGSVASFKAQFSDVAKQRFGSGWAWLVRQSTGTLAVYSTQNQDSPVMQGDTPLLGLDVWEHAYYLAYQNKRPDYIEAWWHVVDWAAVARRYAA